MKRCSSCRRTKPLDQFHKKGAQGRQNNCIECNKDQANEANWKKAGLAMDRNKYRAMSKRQGGRCAICGRTPKETGQKDRELAVDHVPGGTLIRGLLCMDCNTGVGKFGEDAARMRKAAEYVVKHR